MPDVSELVRHWGYAAIFLIVVLGNVGLPVPEESILLLSGYLVWMGRLRLPFVLAVGIASAVAGDNLGYWLGHHFGRRALERYGHRLYLTHERFMAAQRFIARYGALGVFVARFLPGLRFLAGPIAGATGLPPGRFVVSNVLGALVYVPAVVATGYAVGYGLGGEVARLSRVAGDVEKVALAAIAAGGLGALAWRILRARGSGPSR
jgi:membrane protein DedA with SNARE-associated domain